MRTHRALRLADLQAAPAVVVDAAGCPLLHVLVTGQHLLYVHVLSHTGGEARPHVDQVVLGDARKTYTAYEGPSLANQNSRK